MNYKPSHWRNTNRNKRKKILNSFPEPWRCTYCDRPLDGENMTIDHIDSSLPHPDIKDMSNLVLSCRSCNAIKSDLTLQEFIERAERNIVKYQNIIDWHNGHKKHLFYSKDKIHDILCLQMSMRKIISNIQNLTRVGGSPCKGYQLTP